jgi:membrane peptidoglycan carboxypeptidase
MASRALRRRSTYRSLNGHRKDKPRPLLAFVLVMMLGFMMVASGASAATILFYGQDLPSLKAFTKRIKFQDTIIRDRTGRVIYDLADVSRKDRGRRVVEPLIDASHPESYYRQHNQYWLKGIDADKDRFGQPHPRGIPVMLQSATIATEDATFYSNFGFDPMGILRAGYDDVTKGHVVSGASTITQQLIKRFLLNSSPTLSRKVEEVILAAELTQKYAKSEILWYYLNSVPYGNLSIGAEAAAETYFGEHAWQLDLAQSALLAGLPEAPSIYDPITNFPAAKARMQYVLHLMYVHGYLRNQNGKPDLSLADRAMAEAKTWKFKPLETPKRYPHFVQYVIKWLQTQPDLAKEIYNGLDVTTTIDPTLQDAAQGIVSNQIAGLAGQNVTDGAVVTMDLRRSCYGCVLAMVGSPDYKNAAISGQINMADTPRQPGSSFKPFNYAWAFMHGVSPATAVLDGPVAIPDTGNPEDGGWYEPIDYDHTWHGTVSLRVALDNSLNVPAVRVEQYDAQQVGGGLAGIKNTVATLAVKMGIDDLLLDNPSCCGWALTLGGLERGVRLIEETSAFGAFATGGNRVPPIPVLMVRDRTTGRVLWDGRQHFQLHDNVLPAPIAYIMNNVLSDNSSRCTAAVCEFGTDSPLNLGRTAAAKTGTTNAFTDNWTVGYTPDIVTGVWVGNANDSPMIDSTGITGAAPIWNAVMLKAFDVLHLPPKDFVQPTDVSWGSTCQAQGQYGVSYLATSYDAYWAKAGTPLCSLGSDAASSLPVPQTQTSTQAPPPSQPAAPPAPSAPSQGSQSQPIQPAQQTQGTQSSTSPQQQSPPSQQPPATQQSPPTQQSPTSQAPPAAPQQPPSQPSTGQGAQPAPGIQPAPGNGQP